jgi:hypothetical protein
VTANVGFGLCPFGTSPLGFGVPATEDARAGSVLRDEDTGLQTSARSIDPQTRRYTYDANGRALGMSGVRQRVLLAMITDVGTSAVGSLGHGLKAIRVIGSDLQPRVRDVVATALAHMTDTGEITLVDVEARRLREGVVSVVVRWRDNSTGEDFAEQLSP